MKKIYRKMMVLMNRKQKLKMVQILFMMVIGAVLETVSIGLVVPAIQMIMDPSCVEGDSVLAQIYRWTGFQKPGYFTTLILVLIILVEFQSLDEIQDFHRELSIQHNIVREQLMIV